MRKLSKIKKLLKKDKLWREYKIKFKHKQMRLVFSKLALIFQNNLSAQNLYEKEVLMLKTNKKNKTLMFRDLFLNFEKMSNYKADWKSFGKLLWFVFQTSTYWQDKRRNIKNIFINNHIKINSLKRAFFSKWIDSLDFAIDHTNLKVRKVMKVIF